MGGEHGGAATSVGAAMSIGENVRPHEGPAGEFLNGELGVRRGRVKRKDENAVPRDHLSPRVSPAEAATAARLRGPDAPIR